LASNRAKRDADPCPEINRVWEESNEVYDTRPVWHQMQHETFTIARGTVARLMKRQSIHGVDTFADKIVGSRVSSSPKTDFVLNAFEQAA
jgi:hypothetical protein